MDKTLLTCAIQIAASISVLHCGSEATRTDTSSLDASTASVADAGDSSLTGDASGLGAACFAGESVSLADCQTNDCAAFASCPLFGVKCTQGCVEASSRARIHQCAQMANGDCAALQQCVGCTMLCTQGSKCSPPVSEGACCNGCVNRPTCFKPNDPACDVIASCAR